jgi:hypothetical protein
VARTIAFEHGMGVAVGELVGVAGGFVGVALGDVAGSAQPAHKRVAAATAMSVSVLDRTQVIRATTAERNAGDGESSEP